MTIRPAMRRGFSLLEVMLAAAIFLIALVGLSQLMNICTDQAMEIQYINHANQLLQSAMNRVIAGDIALTGSGESSFDDDPDWVYSVTSDAATAPGLYKVTVTVSYKGAGGNEAHSWTLSQMILDPAQRGAIQAPSTSSSPSASTPSGSGNSPPPSGSPAAGGTSSMPAGSGAGKTGTPTGGTGGSKPGGSTGATGGGKTGASTGSTGKGGK